MNSHYLRTCDTMKRRDVNVLRDRTRAHVLSFVRQHLGAAAGAGVGLFSVDSSDLPIFSGPPLAEQCPDEGGDTFQSILLLVQSLHCTALHDPGCRFYLVLVEIGNDHSDKQGEADHAPQEDKNVDVDAMNLHMGLDSKRRISIRSMQASCQVKYLWKSDKK